MTAPELKLEEAFRSIDLKKLDANELNSLYIYLSLKSSEIRWAIKCRTLSDTHLPKAEHKG